MSSSKQDQTKVTKVGKDLHESMQEAIAWRRGEVSLRVFNPALAREVRIKTGLSQAGFAERYHINKRTLQDWEHGRTFPDSVAQAYLKLIAIDASTIARMLEAASL